jgi:adenylosuccinate lyase
MKHSLKAILEKLQALIQAWDEKQKSLMNVPMPGYTHMQRAMPTTVGKVLNHFIFSIVCAFSSYLLSF